MTWLPYVSTFLALLSFFGGLITHYTYVKVEIEKLKMRADLDTKERDEMKNRLDNITTVLTKISGGIESLKTHIEHLSKK
jgi:ribosomal protein S2